MGGCLALGGGESISGRPIEEAGGRVRNVKKSLKLAADALAKGKNIPAMAITLMAKPSIPRWLYLLFGNIGWFWRARTHGCRERLDRTPYQD